MATWTSIKKLVGLSAGNVRPRWLRAIKVLSCRPWQALVVPALLMVAASVEAVEPGKCRPLSRDTGLEPLSAYVREIPRATAPWNGSPSDIRLYIRSMEETPALNSALRGDLALQLEVADAIFSQVLGLTPPLEMPRYRRTQFIAMILRGDPGPLGNAYDEVTRSPDMPECHIRMAINNAVDAAQVSTPTHELFHLYQNAHMMFKQPWMQEGLARWSQGLVQGDVEKGEPLPATREALENLLQKSYGAVSFWQRLFYLVDPEGQVVPDTLGQLRYQSGEHVVTEGRFYGAQFVARLFAELDEASRALAEEQGWPRYNWPEDEQHNLAYNDAILGAVYRAVAATLPAAKQPDELRTFMRLIAPSATP